MKKPKIDSSSTAASLIAALLATGANLEPPCKDFGGILKTNSPNASKGRNTKRKMQRKAQKLARRRNRVK